MYFLCRMNVVFSFSYLIHALSSLPIPKRIARYPGSGVVPGDAHFLGALSYHTISAIPLGAFSNFSSPSPSLHPSRKSPSSALGSLYVVSTTPDLDCRLWTIGELATGMSTVWPPSPTTYRLSNYCLVYCLAKNSCPCSQFFSPCSPFSFPLHRSTTIHHTPIYLILHSGIPSRHERFRGPSHQLTRLCFLVLH